MVHLFVGIMILIALKVVNMSSREAIRFDIASCIYSLYNFRSAKDKGVCEQELRELARQSFLRIKDVDRNRALDIVLATLANLTLDNPERFIAALGLDKALGKEMDTFTTKGDR